jgi:hypothetical protein
VAQAEGEAMPRKKKTLTFLWKVVGWHRDEPLLEPLETEFSPGQPALIVFTTARRAAAFAARLPEKVQYRTLTVRRDDHHRYLPALFKHRQHVVVDPSASGQNGRVLTSFQALVELCDG